MREKWEEEKQMTGKNKKRKDKRERLRVRKNI